MPTLDEVKAQVQKLQGFDRFIAKKEIKELPNILWENEQVENLILGFYNNGNGILVGTSKRLIFIDKGLISLKVEDFPYDKITSIQYETGWVFGKLTIFSSGNKAVIDNVEKNQTKAFGEWVRARISSNTQNQIQTPPQTQTQPNGDDTIAKLEKLAKLKEQGILTQEEFDSQKAKILGL